MNRRLWASLITTVVVVFGVLGANLATGNQPILGLDLQGGVSMILAPEADGVGTGELEITRDLVRDELERSGVAEPDVRVQGQNIVVDLPGIRDPDEVLDRVRVSGIVELRPVLAFGSCAAPTPIPDATVGEPEVLDPDSDPDGVTVTTAVSNGATDDGATSTEPAGFARRGLVRAPDTAPDSVPADSVPVDSVPVDSVPADSVPVDSVPVDSIPVDVPPIDLSQVQSPTAGADLLPTLDGSVLCLGPAQGSGEVFERQGASVRNDAGTGIYVLATLRGDGQATWNALAAQCYNGAPTCPSQGGGRGQLAIALDGVVQSAPQVNAPSFESEVTITGSFSLSEAEKLRDVLNRGAFPVQLEPQDTRTVSPSTGSDSLRAALIAGILGFSLVLTLLIAYYRLLGVVVIAGMITWGAAVYSVASLVSGWTNYTLSLAGVTGIIVAVGVTVDSYIVFFERMKDEIRNGRTPRNAAPRSFNSTWRTIWSADLVSIIAAAILFALSVGSVRGFALYLGITTLCDLLICYLFTRPAVILLARSKWMAGRKAFGLEVAG